MKIVNDNGLGLHGRKTIYCNTDVITKDNVVQMVNDAISEHVQNLYDEDYLYWYRRGVQPVLDRTKEVRPEILNKVVINHADEIVNFKNGYLLTAPLCYIARDPEKQEKVDELNEYIYRSGKHDVDNQIVDWFHTVGRAALYVEPNDDKENPISVYALDPRSAFVVYSMRPGNKPIMGINMVTDDKTLKIDVFCVDKVYRLTGSVSGKLFTGDTTVVATAVKCDSAEDNVLGRIPIIEYSYSTSGMGSFEGALSILDSINDVASNRIDGVSQFIQSLAVAVNCQFDENVTANDIRQAGMIVLRSTGENRADFRILSEQLDQSQTQVLIDDLYEQVLNICGMPSSNRGDSSTSDTGLAVLTRNGWSQASAFALNTEDLFKKSNRLFDEIALDILRRKDILDLKTCDIELKFIRNEEANIQSKAQALQTMLAAGVAPVLAFAKSGVSNDPISDVEESIPYLKMIWGDPEVAELKAKQEKEAILNPPEMNEGAVGAESSTGPTAVGSTGGTAGSEGGSTPAKKEDEVQMGRQAKEAFADRSVAQLDKETGKQIRVFASLKAASEATGVNYRTISDVCNGKSAYGGKWKWKYVSGNRLNGDER